MYAIVNYKGNQILVREGENTRIPFLKDSKIGSTLNFDNVLFFDDGKKKHYGNPILKNINFKAKIVSHERDSKVIVFNKKRIKVDALITNVKNVAISILTADCAPILFYDSKKK